MAAATLGTGHTRDGASTWDDTIPYLVGGWALGVTAVAICSCLDALVLGTIQWLVIGPENQFWPPGAVITAGVGAAIVSVAVGVWLFQLRRWVGNKTDPADFDTGKRKRLHFTIGSMCGFAMVTPFLWVLILGLAFSTAQAPGSIQ